MMLGQRARCPILFKILFLFPRSSCRYKQGNRPKNERKRYDYSFIKFIGNRHNNECLQQYNTTYNKNMNTNCQRHRMGLPTLPLGGGKALQRSGYVSWSVWGAPWWRRAAGLTQAHERWGGENMLLWRQSDRTGKLDSKGHVAGMGICSQVEIGF